MEFVDVVTHRRMRRHFDSQRPVSRETVVRLLELAVQAPSAGFSQGWHFLVLHRREDLDLYWTVTAGPGPGDGWLTGMRTAPVVVLAWSDPERYRRRYALADKRTSPAATTGHGLTGTDLEHWPVAWWDADTAMAGLLVLLGAVDVGLVGAFAGVPVERWDHVRAAFGVPGRLRPVAALALGYPDPGAPPRRTRRRRPLASVISVGRYGSDGRHGSDGRYRSDDRHRSDPEGASGSE